MTRYRIVCADGQERITWRFRDEGAASRKVGYLNLDPQLPCGPHRVEEVDEPSTDGIEGAHR